jgi:hypothetical protein
MRRIRRTALALAACAVIVGIVGVGSAEALTVKPCTGSGSLYTVPSGNPLHPYAWFIQGGGSCPANLQLLLTPKEPQTVKFAGLGTSDSLGICDRSLVVHNLALAVKVRYTNTVTGITTTEGQYWHAPLTLFPVATPFFQSTAPGSGLIGAGLVLHHILLNCNNTGTQPAATFLWAEIRR